MSEETWVYGLDACKAGWVAVGIRRLSEPQLSLCRTFEEAAVLIRDGGRSLIDMPIGLSDAGPRQCDVMARKLLRGRTSSVFNPPIRAAITAPSYAEALASQRTAIGKGFSRQAWGIADRIRQVDEALANDGWLREHLLESHPELCFMVLNGWRPMAWAKSTYFGIRDRLRVLKPYIANIEELTEEYLAKWGGRGVGAGDIVDAAAMAVHADIGQRQGLCSYPPNPPLDAKSLPMQMVVARLLDQHDPHPTPAAPPPA